MIRATRGAFSSRGGPSPSSAATTEKSRRSRARGRKAGPASTSRTSPARRGTSPSFSATRSPARWIAITAPP